MIKYREREHMTVHRNKKLSEFYETLSEPERLIAIKTVNFIKENFPNTHDELLGGKILDSTEDSK